jgi:hypothetical protein
MIMKASALLLILVLSMILPGIDALGQTVDDSYQIETSRYQFSESNKKLFLILPDNKRISIPREWLYPPEDLEEDEGSYVSSFRYSEQVTTFFVDKGLVGIHFSSWDDMPAGAGSAMAGAGRDVFLIYNTETQQIHQGIVDLGITKDRVRSMGCFFATFHDFVVGDVNNDGLTDIGVVLEEIGCKEDSIEQQKKSLKVEPYFIKHPIQWYVFQKNTWGKSTRYRGVRPEKTMRNLPLIGLIKSPTDFIREVYPAP